MTKGKDTDETEGSRSLIVQDFESYREESGLYSRTFLKDPTLWGHPWWFGLLLQPWHQETGPGMYNEIL